MKNQKNNFTLFIFIILAVCISTLGLGPFETKPVQALSVSSYTTDSDGVTFTMDVGKMKLKVCKEEIIRVTYTPTSSFPAKTSLVINKTWSTPSFNVSEASGIVTITTSRIKAKVTRSNGSIAYTDLSDNVILSEDAANNKKMTVATIEGISTYNCETTFNSPADEALYGLGQHQGGIMNYKGQTQTLDQQNKEVAVPVLISNKGYGLLWDNYAKSTFYGNESSNTKYRYWSECGDMIDYYYLYGPEIDNVIKLYREATGKVPLFPKWAYGLFQSMDRYGSQSELLAVKDGYRNNNIPVDCIVQDWHYWESNPWGSHVMDATKYPNPASLITTMHDANVHNMISIWPYFDSGQTHHTELNNVGALYTPSSGSYYDPYNASGRTTYWTQMKEHLFANYGWDAWWADSCEPDSWPVSWNRHAVNTALGKGCFYYNAYPLVHTRAFYDGWRADMSGTGKRAFTLARSAFAGQQRNAATTWSGDTNSDWSNYVKQIPAGLNFCLSGLPYWTQDIGGYFGTDFTTAANRELFTRWFQHGTFNPIFRIHGKNSRELYSSTWDATTKANLLKFDNLRYRLMPYLYSLAWKVTNEGYTIMRHLVFDYRTDSQVKNIGDQFLFGPSLMVNPVTAAGATTRSVYLPSGKWIDFWTGNSLNGGQTMIADAPLDRIPIYAKAGAIIPMGPMIQYATQSVNPMELRIYRGADGSFTLYEDEGDKYSYESGSYATIPLTWSESQQRLTIGARTGSFTGMLASRTFNIVWVSSGYGTGVNLSSSYQTSVNYTGSSVAVNFDPGWIPPGVTPVPTATPAPTPGPLPAPWVFNDIGSPGLPGLGGYNNGVFTVTGSGADIWDISDQFAYVHQGVTGDSTIVARITSQTNSDPWAKAGVMFRETTGANSAYVDLVITPANGLNLQWRDSAGGTCNWTGLGTYSLPLYLKLVRSGNTFTAYKSSDGTNWGSALGSHSTTMTGGIKAGMCVTSHNNTVTSTAKFDNVIVSGGAATATPTPTLTPTPTSNGPRYEAENAVLSGGAKINTDHPGYSGTGFVDGYHFNVGATTTFTVNVGAAGNYNAVLRYSAGFGTSANTGLYVNGVKIKNITCNGTGNWDTWANQTEIVTLNSGSNTIAYKSESSVNTSINLDCIDLTGGATATPTPTPAATPTPTPGATATPTPTPVSGSDEFTSGTLGSQWSWVREDNTKWSLTANPGYMRITTQQGDIYGTTNTMKNILLQTPGTTDYNVVVKLTFSPTTNWHQAGILAYANDDNYIMLDRVYYDGNKFGFKKEIAAAVTDQNVTDSLGATVYLKLSKSGTSYSGYYSSDGATWTLITTYTGISLTNPKVGIYAASGGASPAAINADFDYFRYQ